MKPLLLDKSTRLNSSFSVKFRSYNNFLKVWHYHSHIELVVLLKSTGSRFIGNHIDQFEPGEVILIGKNLPHMWANGDEYFEKDSKLKAEAIAIHFKEDFAGKEFLNIPEMASISKLIERARLGVKFNGGRKSIIITKIKKLLDLNSLDRFVGFLGILHELSMEKDYELLSSPTFIDGFSKVDKRKLEPIYSFIINNYKKGFSLNDISGVACMNPSAFSRFFKKIHKKTLTRYVNELRVGHACKILLENKYSMTEICYESGFNNLSNFNRQFKSILNFTPSEYIGKYLKVEVSNDS